MTNLIKVPATINIGSHSYRIWFDEREDDGDFKGSTLYRKREVLLNPSQHPQDLKITYLHEVIHTIAEAYSQRVPEEAVAVLAQGLGTFIYNNLDIDLDFSDIPSRKVDGRE